MEKVTTDTILNFLKEAIESKRIMNEELWSDAAFKLNVLLADEHLLLEDLRMEVAKKYFHLNIPKNLEYTSRNKWVAETKYSHRTYSAN